MSANRLCLHVGAHKTATTSLQLYFKQNARLLKKENVTYILPDEINSQGLIQFLHGHPSQPIDRAVEHSRYLRDLQQKAKTETVLISHESFFSYAGDPSKARIYQTLERGIERFKLINSFEEVSILIVLREPSAFMQSVYLQNLGNTYCKTFREWFEDVELSRLSWKPIIEGLQGLGGVDLPVFFFEDV